MSPKTKLLIAAIFSTLSSSFAFGALYGFGPAETWTIMKIIGLTTDVTTNITSFGTSFGLQMQSTFERIISSVAVSTKQEALSSNVVSDSTRQAAEQLVNAVRAQRQNDQLTYAYLDYNPATGQGYDPCGTTAKNKSMDLAFQVSEQFAKESLKDIDVAPGRLVESSTRAMQHRLENHRENFCSDAEASNGICTKSDLPGGDINAAILFEPASADSLQHKARMAYIQHVLGEPDQLLPSNAGHSRAGDSFMQAKITKDSMLSVPGYSLAKIAANNTRSDEFGNRSPNEMLRIRVNQYFGGKEAEEWSGSMARQTTRGLMVEELKMAGLEIWLMHKQYEQNQRIQANLSTMVLAKTNAMTGMLNIKYQKVLNDNTTSNIK